VVTVPLNDLETGGTGLPAFDFQSRPVVDRTNLWLRFIVYYGSRTLFLITNMAGLNLQKSKNSKIKLTRRLSPGSLRAQEEISAGARIFWLEQLDFHVSEGKRRDLHGWSQLIVQEI
jgi:hypothetical protein